MTVHHPPAVKGEASAPSGVAAAPEARRPWLYRVHFLLIVILLFFTAVLLPLTAGSVVSAVLGSSEGQLFMISTTPHSAAAPTHTDLLLQVVGLDEIRGVVTVQVLGYHICDPECAWSDRVHLFSIWNQTQLEGFPPSASVTLPPSRYGTTQTVQLPVRGQPLRYPFDSYELPLGIALERVFPDGTTESVPTAEARSHLFVGVIPSLPQETMDPPAALDPRQGVAEGAPIEYVYATRLTIHRLAYLQGLSLLLVLLVAAAAVYAVFLRPFQDLVINVGALILGIWGIRAVLVPYKVQYITAVDLSLSVVILFLLGAISVRALIHVYQRGGWPARRRIGE